MQAGKLLGVPSISSPRVSGSVCDNQRLLAGLPLTIFELPQRLCPSAGFPFPWHLPGVNSPAWFRGILWPVGQVAAPGALEVGFAASNLTVETFLMLLGRAELTKGCSKSSEGSLLWPHDVFYTVFTKFEGNS